METPTTATATNPTDSPALTAAPASTLATAGADAGKPQQTQTTETPAAEKPAGTPDGKPAAAPAEAAQEKDSTPAAAPEKYEFKAPGGTEFDPDVLATYSGAAKEAGLTQDAAQKLIEKMAPALAARRADQVQAIHKEWLDASSADPEFGGEKLKENLGVAKKALDAFDPVPSGSQTTPLRTLLDETGLGNHPELIRMLVRAGMAISEDKFVGGAPRGTSALKPADVLYDKTAKAS